MKRRRKKHHHPNTGGRGAGRKPPRAVDYMLWIARSFLCGYLLTVTVGLPFYHPEGNILLATHKQALFLAGAAFLVPAGILGVAALAGAEGRSPFRIANLSSTDRFVLLYMTVLSFSFLASAHKDTAVMGESGWKLGLVPQLAFILGFFLVSRIWKPGWRWPALFLPVTTVVYLFTALERFGVRPFTILPYSDQYLFTVGNINWYCGYLVTLLFAALFFYLWAPFTRKWHSAGLLLYLWLGFLSLSVQGSSSGLLTLAVMLTVLFCLCASSAERMARFGDVVLALGTACSTAAAVRRLFPDALTYSDFGTELLTSPALSLTALFLGLAGALGLRRAAASGRYPRRLLRIARLCLPVSVTAGLLGFAALLIANTAHPGCIGSLSRLPVFTFSPEWGSKRGATWTAGFHCFLEGDPLRKLIGAGPDCMLSVLRQCPHEEIRLMLEEQFGAPLTNAHNELLTTLVNEGLLGAVFYTGILATAICRFLRFSLQPQKSGDKNAFLPAVTRAFVGACGCGILAYAVHNTVSFAQILNTPTMYLLLGMGEGCYRFSRSPESPCSS